MTKALVDLLKSLFTVDELRRLAAFLANGNLTSVLPSGTASLDAVAFEMVQALKRCGQLDHEFFTRLEDERPGRKAEINRIRSLILDPKPKQPDIIDFTGERSRHEHFFGRQDILRELDDWLRGRDSGWLLLTGSPGLGKSAIFNHWLGLREQAGLPVAFHFIRRGIHNSADPAGVSASLAARIERDFPEQRDPDAEPAQRLEQLLHRVSPVLEQRRQQLVLLVDGLDEAMTLDGADNPIPRIFPDALPGRVFVYAASRSSYPHLEWFRQRTEPRYTINLDGQPGNLETVHEFWAALHGTLSPPPADDLVRVAVERSEGNLLHAVKLYQLWNQAGAKRSIDTIPQGKGRSSGFRERRGDGWRRLTRWRERVLAAGLAVAAAIAIRLGTQWQRPTLSVPALPASGGVVVTGGRLDSGGRGAWQHLCTTLRELGEQAVQCVAPPAPPDDELVAAARAAGASLVITVEAGPAARVLPVPGRDGEQFLRGLPAVSIARPETRIALAQIAYVLALGPRAAPSGVAARLPIEPEYVMPWRVTALAALARLWTQAAWDNQNKVELSGIARRCREEPASLADAHCALIHYVLYAEVAPEDPDARARLDELVERGPQGIADAATLFLLPRRCIEDPVRTRQALLELAARLQDCQRWYLMTPATCVLVASRRDGADGVDDAAIRALAEPDEHAGNTCPEDVRAGAYYDRAHWLAETWNASTREEWEQAVASYQQAFRLDRRADHAQGLAEALLFLRRLVPERSDELARRALEVLGRTAVDVPTAVFLAWLAGDASDADGLDRVCAVYRELAPGEIAVPYVSRRLACPGGEGDDSLGCRAYQLLSAPRPVASGGDLEKSVCAGSDKGFEL
jgi:hypothetical protein